MITREGLYASSDTLGAMGDAIEVFLIDQQRVFTATVLQCG